MNEITKDKINKGYALIFFHPNSTTPIYLAYNANILNICYSENPYLPGTTDKNDAKIYKTIEEAKSDIYLLRYHHRAFLDIMIGAKIVEVVERNHLPAVVENYELKDLKKLEK